jgi:hypothetical protein
VNRAPLTGGNVLVPVEIEGKAGQVTVDRRASTPSYFAAAGIPLVEGRDFTSEDQPQSEHSAILNRTAALQFWPDGPALGRRLRLILRNGPGPWIRVVGIAGDIRHMASIVPLFSQKSTCLTSKPPSKAWSLWSARAFRLKPSLDRHETRSGVWIVTSR